MFTFLRVSWMRARVMNARKMMFGFVVAGVDTSVAFEPAEEPLHFVSPLVYLAVVVPFVAAVALGWDDRRVALFADRFACVVSFVRSVCYQEQFQLLPFRLLLLLGGRQLSEKFPPPWSIMVLTCGEDRILWRFGRRLRSCESWWSIPLGIYRSLGGLASLGRRGRRDGP